MSSPNVSQFSRPLKFAGCYVLRTPVNCELQILNVVKQRIRVVYFLVHLYIQLIYFGVVPHWCLEKCSLWHFVLPDNSVTWSTLKNRTSGTVAEAQSLVPAHKTTSQWSLLRFMLYWTAPWPSSRMVWASLGVKLEMVAWQGVS